MSQSTLGGGSHQPSEEQLVSLCFTQLQQIPKFCAPTLIGFNFCSQLPGFFTGNLLLPPPIFPLRTARNPCLTAGNIRTQTLKLSALLSVTIESMPFIR